MDMATTGPGNTLSVFSLLEALRRRKLFIIIPTLVLTAGFSFYAYQQPNRYRAQALLAAERTTPPEYLRHFTPPPLNIQEHLWTVREVLFSTPVLEGAARELALYRKIEGPLPEQALNAVKSNINIKIDAEHTFFVSYDGPDRYEVMNVTNRLAEQFIKQASANREQKVEDAATVIQGQLGSLRQRLEEQDRQIRQYKQQAVHELPEHVDTNIRALDDLRDRYRETTAKIADDEARRTQIINELKELEAKGVLEQPVIVEKTPAELRLEQLRIRLKELETRYTPQHPEIIQTKREIGDLERAITAQPKKARSEPSATYLRYLELKSEPEAIDQRAASYRKELENLNEQMGIYRARIASSPQHERAIEAMRREYHVGEMQLRELMDKQLDANMAEGLEKAESNIAFGIVEPASLPTQPYSPRRERLVLMGLLAGLGLGLVMAFFVEQNDTTFFNVDDFQSFTTLPVMGVIPNIPTTKNGRSRDAKARLVTLNDPNSVAAEQYRILAMKVQQGVAGGMNTLMITSAAGGEGKSITAINLSMALAALVDGEVLLVDADMRKPCLHDYLNLSVGPGCGFHDLLLKPADDYRKYTMKVRNLHVIPGGAPASNPVVPLASPKARALFDRLRQDFRFVIIDAPPTLPIADSHVLSGLSDKVLFVIRARQTPRELFQHAVESFEAANLLAAVLNDVDYQRSRYAYAYDYYKTNDRHHD